MAQTRVEESNWALDYPLWDFVRNAALHGIAPTAALDVEAEFAVELGISRKTYLAHDEEDSSLEH